MKTIRGIRGLRNASGSVLGCSDWERVTQDRVNAFAEVTGDRQWIHVDPERAASGPFGAAVAHGYFTLSLGPAHLSQIFEVEGVSGVINYGCDKVRFPAPLVVGNRVRVVARLSGVTDAKGGVQASIELTFDTDVGDKPVCMADVLYRYLE